MTQIGSLGKKERGVRPHCGVSEQNDRDSWHYRVMRTRCMYAAKAGGLARAAASRTEHKGARQRASRRRGRFQAYPVCVVSTGPPTSHRHVWLDVKATLASHNHEYDYFILATIKQPACPRCSNTRRLYSMLPFPCRVAGTARAPVGRAGEMVSGRVVQESSHRKQLRRESL